MVRAKIDIVVLTTVDVAGGRERAAETETLVAAWDEGRRGTRTTRRGVPRLVPRDGARESDDGGLVGGGNRRARAALGDERGGVVLVLGSLNTVAKARAWARARAAGGRGEGLLHPKIEQRVRPTGPTESWTPGGSKPSPVSADRRHITARRARGLDDTRACPPPRTHSRRPLPVELTKEQAKGPSPPSRRGSMPPSRLERRHFWAHPSMADR